ncbi:hypothetical protein [Streptomyces olivochromogenes]|uniref:hypothetical protein n=1 Tax=Streptomyces olivochromogenes TaxID=1963 RepID=UPI001F3B68D4|nr:hypothetical protein [Streptomyces olivochromogenes]MCF3128934.1 hypothetical protein [Streptomyces olivochromogenes]
MTATGAPSPRRAGLARITEATARVGAAWREHRSWHREQRAATGVFHDDLGLRPGASVQDVLDAVAELRGGRTIEPIPLDSLPPLVSGMAVLGEEEDYIAISTRLSPRHRAHVLLHEVRHLLPFNAGGATGSDCSIAVHRHFDGVTLQSLEEQMSALPARVRAEILTRPAKLRAGYPDDEEFTCELFARVVLPLLDLDPTSKSTGSLASAFSNRRAI